MLTLKTPAKINWFLHVMDKRRDGYHNLQSLMQCVSLYDTLSLEEYDDIDVLTESDIPPEKNLVYKAALLLNEKYGSKKGARITLKKDIPIEAGLGGGSTDAAAALRGLNSLWGLDVPEAELASLGASLGSDIPFFLSRTAALVEGRGERITPVELSAPHILLIVKPTLGVSAGWAYSQLEELGKPSDYVFIKKLVMALENGDYPTLRDMASNDLEAPVLKSYPEIRELKDRLLDCGASLSVMSGSGSSVFGLFKSRSTAEEAVASFPQCWTAVVETLSAGQIDRS
jgi:4-diphosphocytidyl-2-C-methyl-D-erythritol kinase